MADRHAANPKFSDDVRAAYAGVGPPVLVEKRVKEPSRRKKPAMVGTQFMGDLFHSKVPFDFVDKVMDVVATNPQHTFLVLTKRPERMFDYFYGENVLDYRGPRTNLWLGVTVENQRTAVERIPLLLQTPAFVRFLSCEPLLGPIDFVEIAYSVKEFYGKKIDGLTLSGLWDWLHWVIVGGESGTNARPMHPDWARSLRDQCRAAGIPFHFKQWGAWLPFSDWPHDYHGWSKCQYFDNSRPGPPDMVRVGKHRAGRLLDGKEWNDLPLR